MLSGRVPSDDGAVRGIFQETNDARFWFREVFLVLVFAAKDCFFLFLENSKKSFFCSMIFKVSRKFLKRWLFLWCLDFRQKTQVLKACGGNGG